MFDFVNVCRALSDENRLRILMALEKRELCVCQVTAFLDLAPSTTSKHLSVLRQARLIESHKKGRWVYYSLPDQAASMVTEALQWMQQNLSKTREIMADETRISHILKAEVDCGFTTDSPEEAACFHSVEMHSLDQQLSNERTHPTMESSHDQPLRRS